VGAAGGSTVVVTEAVVVTGAVVVAGAGVGAVVDAVVPATTPVEIEPATTNPSTSGNARKTRFIAGKV
jgi:hypothetical protein